MAKQTREKLTSSERSRWAVVGLISLIIAYLVASRAIDTGSWWEYGAMLAFLITAINRLLYAFHGAR